MYFIINLIIVLLLTNCSEKEESVPNNPANIQIEEYSKDAAPSDPAKDCDKEKKEEDATKNIANDNDINKQNQNIQPKTIATPSLEINENDMVYGDRNSKVVVIEYIAPTCPHCAYYHKEIFPKLQERYIRTNKVAYIVRNFIANKLDLDASVLAYCSKNPESFLKFTNVILQQQETWSISSKYREILTNIGNLGGISAEQYAACLNDKVLLEYLWNNSQAVAKSPKFIGTPAFFVNGVQLGGPYSITALTDSIDSAINSVADKVDVDKS